MTATVLWLLNNAHIITALYYLITIRNCFLSLINRINYFLFHFKGYRRDFLKKHMDRSDSKIWNMSSSLENCKISRLGNLIHSSFLQLEKKILRCREHQRKSGGQLCCCEDLLIVHTQTAMQWLPKDQECQLQSRVHIWDWYWRLQYPPQGNCPCLEITCYSKGQ